MLGFPFFSFSEIEDFRCSAFADVEKLLKGGACGAVVASEAAVDTLLCAEAGGSALAAFDSKNHIVN